jgi:hypothetical protein
VPIGRPSGDIAAALLVGAGLSAASARPAGQFIDRRLEPAGGEGLADAHLVAAFPPASVEGRRGGLLAGLQRAGVRLLFVAFFS